MRTLLKWCGIAAALVATGWALWVWNYPTYTHRYRLTIEVEVDGKVATGSSVWEASWHTPPPLAPSSLTWRARGQAVSIELGSKGLLLAALVTDGNSKPGGNFSHAADLAVRVIYGRRARMPTENPLRDLQNQSGRRAIGSDDMPMLIWLPNPDEPKSAVALSPHEFPARLGPSVRYIGAHLEMTRDALTGDIHARLPWLITVTKPRDEGSREIDAVNFRWTRRTLLGR